MIGHLFKMIWNRRRANALILVELLISFVALCGVLTAGCLFWHRWSEPLGYEWDRGWRLEIETPRWSLLDDDQKAAQWTAMDRMLLAFQGMEEIEATTALSSNVPFGSSFMGTSRRIEGVSHRVRKNQVLPEALEVLAPELVAGRWLREGDREMAWQAVVVDRGYARRVFGNEDPIGRPLPVEDIEDEPERERRVVGLVGTWKPRGELGSAEQVEFTLAPWGGEHRPPSHFVLKLREGVPAAFEEELLRTVQQIAPDWDTAAVPLAEMRQQRLKDGVIPLIVSGTVVAFLGVMVGLGLVGVLWQSVTRRTEEIGVRRALGASAWGIRGQVLGELLALVTVAAGIGSALYLQLPLLGIRAGGLFGAGGAIPLAVYLTALGLALAVVYSFVFVCGLYPSWLATRVEPAAALQWE